jgi:hypothetical protein
VNVKEELAELDSPLSKKKVGEKKDEGGDKSI